MARCNFTPRTVLAAGFSQLGAAPAGTAPKLRKNAKQPKPPKEPKMSTPKVQIPAKRAPKRCAPDENYATQYVPPVPCVPEPCVPEPCVPEPCVPAVSAIDLVFNDIKIEDNVPLPGHASAATKQDVMGMLLGRMDLKQSACLDFGYKSSLLKAIQAAHKVTGKRFTVKRRHDGDNTIRVWRVA
jgi:hypothetical protein